MRLRENEIELASKHIVHKLLSGFIELDVDKAEILERIKKIIHDDLLIEDNLNREVEDILKSHAKEIQGGAIDYRKMFSMIKNKLAKERGLILS